MSNIIQGDNGTLLEFTVKDDSGVVDLSNAQSVLFRLKKSFLNTVEKVCTVTDSVNGKAQVTLSSSDTDPFAHSRFSDGVEKGGRAGKTRLVLGRSFQEGGPALPLGLLDVQVLPDRQHARLLQPPRGRLSPREAARDGLRDADRSRLDRRLPVPSEQVPGPRRLLHLGRGRNVVP